MLETQTVIFSSSKMNKTIRRHLKNKFHNNSEVKKTYYMFYLYFVVFILLFFAFIYSIFKVGLSFHVHKMTNSLSSEIRFSKNSGNQNRPSYFILKYLHKLTNLTLISLLNVILTAQLSEVFCSQFCLPFACTTSQMRLARRFVWRWKLRKNLVGMRATWKSAHRYNGVKHTYMYNFKCVF